jgi:uncharacterized membrane protein YphA (DoxX/SURF4 family)
MAIGGLEHTICAQSVKTPMLSLLVPLLVLVLVLAVVALATTATAATATTPTCHVTRFFLILLRLSIGWHFLFEGVEKLNNPSWSSEGYLREASGPLAPSFHALTGDRLRERLTVTEGRFPEQLGQEWEDYRERFTAHYQLNPEQDKMARTKLEQAKQKTRKWLTVDVQVVKMPTLMGQPLDLPLTVPERVKLYEAALARSEDVLAKDQRQGGKDPQVEAQQTRADANRIRSELRKDLDKQTRDMIADLRMVLKPEQTKDDPKDDPIPPPATRPSFPNWSLLDLSDFLVKWGLVVLGVCLLVGLFTRSACLAGAAFLLSLYLAMPPLPGLIESPKTEGHYVFVNKNIIEMLALLTLATTRSGRWLGLDALLQFLRPRTWRRPRPETVPVGAAEAGPVSAPAPAVGSLTTPASSEEITHGS